MPKLKITDHSVNKIKYPTEGQVFYWDTKLSRFGIRVGIKTKTFICEKKTNGKTTRVSLGAYPAISVTDARKKAAKTLTSLSDGINPNTEKKEMRMKSITLHEVYLDYIKSRDLRKDTLYQYQAAICQGYKNWLHLEMRSITKDMIEQQHERFNRERGPQQANKFTRTLRALFNFTIAKYEINDKPVVNLNPVERMSQARLWNKPARRTGHLNAHHLNAWFKEVNKQPNDTIRDYLQFVLFTGARRREASSLLWSDIHMENRSFIIREPKNHNTIELPLSSFLYELLNKRERINDYVFHSPRSASGHIEEPKKVVKSIGEAIDHHFTIHDLRRTFITFAESLDISQYALKALVNHKMSSSDVTAGYLQISVDRLRKPMQSISDFILESAQI